MISPNVLRLSLTRRSLSRFAQVVMPSYEVDRCHRMMIDYVEDLLSGKIRKLAIICPPRIGKSTLGNVIAPAFTLGRNPLETIISISYGSELSEGFGRRVRNILSDPAFHEVFPGCKLSPDSAAAYRFTTTAGGEYSAVGRGGPITGRGASLLVLDDLIKDSSEAQSDTICRGIIEWLQHVCFTRLTPNGRVLAIATRWSERDPMGWILQQQGWRVLHLPAFAESANDPLGREVGEALWPSHYPVEALEAIKADVGPRVFACLYQGNVAASQGTIFKRDWFRRYAAPPESFNRIIQSWDTSYKTGATNDYSVCATFGQTQNGFYLLSLYRAKVEFPELKRQVAQQADFWKPSEIYIEDRASGQSLVQEVKLATHYPVIPVKVDRDKETRASACTGYFESGRVLFPEGAAWLSDLEDELASFPGGLHDDQVDAIAQALNRMRDSGGVLGLVEAFKGFFSGKRHLPATAEQILRGAATKESKAATVTLDQWKIWNEQHRAPACPHPSCKNASTALVPDARGDLHIFCKQCGRTDGRDLPGTDQPGHTHRWRSIPGGMEKCDDCGEQRPTGNGPRSTTVGVSRAEYAAMHSVFGRACGRFRR